MRLKSILVGLLAFAACTTPVKPGAHPNIYVMRHLHTPAGVSDPELTEEGRRHAQMLSDRLRVDPPDVIYVSDTKRARQTADPLAVRLKLAPKLYDPRDTPGLIASVEKEAGTVLIVGHSNTVPDIVEGLGGQRPPTLVHEDFGDIWHIKGAERATTRSRIG